VLPPVFFRFHGGGGGKVGPSPQFPKLSFPIKNGLSGGGGPMFIFTGGGRGWGLWVWAGAGAGVLDFSGWGCPKTVGRTGAVLFPGGKTTIPGGGDGGLLGLFVGGFFV